MALPILPTPLALALTILPPVMLPVDTVKLVPVSAAPVTAPVADIKPTVRKLPPCTLPVAVSDTNVVPTNPVPAGKYPGLPKNCRQNDVGDPPSDIR